MQRGTKQVIIIIVSSTALRSLTDLLKSSHILFSLSHDNLLTKKNSKEEKRRNHSLLRPTAGHATTGLEDARSGVRRRRRARRLLSPAQARGLGAGIEDDILALEEDVADDGETDAGVPLDTTEAGAAARGRVVDVVTGDGALGVANDEGEAGQVGGAGEDVAAVAGAVLRVLHLLVVGADDVLGQVEESGASVGDGVDRGGGLGLAVTDREARGLELPEAVGRININIGDVASVTALNYRAKIIAGSNVSRIRR